MVIGGLFDYFGKLHLDTMLIYFSISIVDARTFCNLVLFHFSIPDF